MKNTEKNSFEPVDKQHYKKSYLKRIIEKEEAEEELLNWRNGRAKTAETFQRSEEVQNPSAVDEGRNL